eukprot:scaffold231060_cov66-Cyclotella_meneghiniana.AAC.1
MPQHPDSMSMIVDAYSCDFVIQTNEGRNEGPLPITRNLKNKTDQLLLLDSEPVTGSPGTVHGPIGLLGQSIIMVHSHASFESEDKMTTLQRATSFSKNCAEPSIEAKLNLRKE